MSNKLLSDLTFEYTDDPIANAKIYKLTIPYSNMLDTKYTDFDRALFKDIEEGSAVTIADQLLGLETFVRRIEEQRQRNNLNATSGEEK